MGVERRTLASYPVEILAYFISRRTVVKKKEGGEGNNYSLLLRSIRKQFENESNDFNIILYNLFVPFFFV